MRRSAIQHFDGRQPALSFYLRNCGQAARFIEHGEFLSRLQIARNIGRCDGLPLAQARQLAGGQYQARQLSHRRFQRKQTCASDGSVYFQ